MGRLQRDVLEAALRVAPLADPRLVLDVGGGHRRPAVGGVADDVLVRADMLALHDRQRLEAGHVCELLADHRGEERLDRFARLGGRCRPLARRMPGPHTPDELEHLVASRHERNDEVIVIDLAHRFEPRLRQVPRVLVVEHHRQAVERLELRDRLAAVQDLLVAVRRVVRIMFGKAEREVRRVARDLRHGRLHGRELGRVVALVAEYAEQPAEDAVLGLGVPGRGKLGPRLLDGRHLALGLAPGRQQRQEDVIPMARQVAPSRRALLVHRHRVAVAPDQVHREVAQQRGAGVIHTRLDAFEDLGAGRRLGLEVALHHRFKLLQRLEDREVQVRAEVGGEDQPAVAVDDEGPHGFAAGTTCPCRR